MSTISAPPRGTRSRKAASSTSTSSGAGMATEPLKISKRATTDSSTAPPAPVPASGANTTTSSTRSGRLRRRKNKVESDNGRCRLADLSLYSQLNEDRKEEHTTYFVLPQGLTPATCSHSLTSAFTAANEASIACKWMTTEECLAHTPLPENLFVMDPFSGPAFDYVDGFKKKDMCFLLGPQILKYLIGDEPSVDFGKAPSVYSVGMRNVLITQTGVTDPVRKAELSLKITRMFGMESKSLTKGVTHVVAEHMLTDKVFMAYETNIPVMSTKWIDAVWEDSQNQVVNAIDQQYVKYACPIFHNMIICVSQVSPGLKEALRNVIEANGGQYCAELLKNKTTVLIVPKPEGDKFKYAQQWRLPCVFPEWVEACKSAGHVKSPADFLVTSPVNRTTPTPVTTSKDKVKNFVTSTPLCSMAESFHAGVMQHSMLSNINGTCPREMPTNIEDTEEDILKKVAELIKNGSQTIAPFLDGCQIYIGKAINSVDIRKLISSAGAVRLEVINDSVTHVIIPQNNQLQRSELQRIKELDPRPCMVRLEWLLESAKEGNAINDEKYKLIIDPNNSSSLSVVPESSVSQSLSISAMVETGGNATFKNTNISSKHSSERSLDAAVTAVGGLSSASSKSERRSARLSEEANDRSISKSLRSGNISSSRLPSMVEMGDQCPDLEMEHGEGDQEYSSSNGNQEEDSDPTARIFVGQTFSVEMEMEEESEEVRKALIDCGGKLSDNEYDILIVSPIYSPEMLVKPGAILRTKQWVFDCIENATMEGDILYHHSPLPAFPGMLDILPGVVVAISQYPNPEKEYLAVLITAMGGLCQDVFARKTSKDVQRSTHLICPKTDNEKYRAAEKWVVPVVVAEWVRDCFNSHVKQPIEPYITATRSDSQGTINYLPKTPTAPSSTMKGSKLISKVQLRKDVVQTGDQQEEPQPPAQSTPKASGSGGVPFVFKTPVSKESKAKSNELYEPPEETESFLEYCRTHKTPDLTMDKSYQEWLKTRPKTPSPSPSELSPIIGEHMGFTRADSRALKRELAMNGNHVPPRKPYYVTRRSSTPIKEHQKKTIDAWPDLYFGEDNDADLGNGEMVQPEAEDIEIEANNIPSSSRSSRSKSNKRSSDSSLERVEPESSEDSFVHGRGGVGARSSPKRRRISSSDSERGEISSLEEGPADSGVTRNSSTNSNRTRNSSTTGPSADNSGCVSNELEAESKGKKTTTKKSGEEEASCSNRDGDGEVGKKSPEMRQSFEGRPARRMEKLKNLLAGSNDGAATTPKSSTSTSKAAQKNGRRNEQDDDDKPNEDELGAPAVVWATEPDERILADPSQNQRSSRKSSRVSPVPVSGIPSKIPVNTGKRRNIRFSIPVPPNPVFILSGLTDETKASIKESLGPLGAIFTETGNFDKSAFAILADTLARSEKILCGIASGKPLLRSGYADACRDANELLPVTEEFLWKGDDDLAKAAYTWVKRIRLDPNDTPFQGQSFFILPGPDAKKVEAYMRLIQAGRGSVVPLKEEATIILASPPLTGPLKPVNGIPMECVTYLSNMIVCKNP